MSPHRMSPGRMSPVEGPAGPTRGRSVLDIGGDVGAAVVLTPGALEGEELEIRPAGGEWNGTHTGVRRRGPGCCAALFPALPAGRYEIRVADSGSAAVLVVDVVGGQVATGEWRPAGS